MEDYSGKSCKDYVMLNEEARQKDLDILWFYLKEIPQKRNHTKKDAWYPGWTNEHRRFRLNFVSLLKKSLNCFYKDKIGENVSQNIW